MFTSVLENGEDSFFFVHQTRLQQQLLHLYGTKMVILDSTYKTTKYDILLCVLTKPGYHVVSLFLIGRETTVQIKKACRSFCHGTVLELQSISRQT